MSKNQKHVEGRCESKAGLTQSERRNLNASIKRNERALERLSKL